MSLVIDVAKLIFDTVFNVVSNNDAVQFNPDAMLLLKMTAISFSVAIFVLGLPLWILKIKR